MAPNDCGQDTIDLEWLKSRTKKRIFKALDYVAIFTITVFIYCMAVLADYALFAILWRLLDSDANKFPLVAKILDFVKISLAIVFIINAFIHGILSTYRQIQLDIKLSNEENEGNNC